MASVTDLCNMALARIGSGRINAISDTTAQAIQCRLHYDQTRLYLLRGYSWNFAKAEATLSQDASMPESKRWGTPFILPADYLLLLEVNSRRFEIVGNRLYVKNPCGGVTIEYVRDITDPAQFDSLFAETLILKLALSLVMPLTQDQKLRISIGQELNAAMAKARTINAAEDKLGQQVSVSWLGSRRVNAQGSYKD